jgi:AraC-like DNA-binding protein
MRHASYRPLGTLARWVACFWFWEGAPQPHGQEQRMPNGEASIVFNLREEPIRLYDSENRARFESYGAAVFTGPRTRPFVIDTSQQERVFGIQFRPGGSWPFFAPPVSEFANLSISLNDLWRGGAGELREQLLAAREPATMFAVAEQCLLRAMRRDEGMHPAVGYALQRLAWDSSTLLEVSKAIGLSQRRFSEVFRHQVGLSPKAFHRLSRFQRVLAQVHGQTAVNWTAVAHECGYYDQPHFNHDFREFSGFSPGDYLTRATEHRNHVPLD